MTFSLPECFTFFLTLKVLPTELNFASGAHAKNNSLRFFSFLPKT